MSTATLLRASARARSPFTLVARTSPASTIAGLPTGVESIAAPPNPLPGARPIIDAVMPLEFTKEYRQNVAPLMQQLANLDVVRDMVDGAECVRKEYYWPAGLSRMIQAPETLIYGALATRDNLPIVPLVFKWQCGCTPKHLNAKAYSSSFKERLQAGTSTDLRVPGLSMVQFLGSGLKFESTLGVDSSSTSLGDSGPAAVHPGVSAALLDDITARLTFSNAPNKTTFTANFQLDYLAPVPIDSFVVMDAWITAREGRKTFVYSHLAHALSGQMLVRARSLFVSTA